MRTPAFKITVSILFYFFLYGFLGWIMDTACNTFFVGHLDFGGMFKSFFLPIPFAPIYGFGALILIACSKFLEKRGNFSLFFLTGILMTAVEYVGGVFMVNVLYHRAWDYSGNFANFQGHIDLRTSIMWMFLGWFFIRYFHPVVRKLAGNIIK